MVLEECRHELASSAVSYLLLQEIIEPAWERFIVAVDGCSESIELTARCKQARHKFDLVAKQEQKLEGNGENIVDFEKAVHDAKLQLEWLRSDWQACQIPTR